MHMVTKRSALALISWNFFDLTKLPFFVTQRTHGPGLQPPLNAIEVEHVPARAEGD